MKAWETLQISPMAAARTVSVIVHENSLTENSLAAVTNNTNCKFHF